MPEGNPAYLPYLPEMVLPVTLFLHLAPKPGMVKLARCCTVVARFLLSNRTHDNLWRRSLVIYNESR